MLVLAVWLLFAPSVSLAEEEARRIVLEKYAGEIIGLSKTDGAYLVELAADAGIYRVEVRADNGKIRSISQLARHDSDPDRVEPDPALPNSSATEQHAEDGSFDGQSADPVPSPATEPTASSNPSGKPSTDHPSAPAKKPVPDGAKPEQQPAKQPHNEPGKQTGKQPNHGPDQQPVAQPAQPVQEPVAPSSNKPDPTGHSRDKSNLALITEQEAIGIAEQHTGGEADDADLILPDDAASPYWLVEVEWDDDDLDLEAVVQVDAYTGEVKSVTWEDD